eukprot:TRINITY_DN2484_c1_g1_i1.p1 TRINITY_DN2484_c1_g1~~TRINITY_DN2484_c1_g1_i1.p1  ORF type:complete len:545 (-),score=62.01 TRINITY_DN2484_c1_g1_i1:45-1679(-)
MQTPPVTKWIVNGVPRDAPVIEKDITGAVEHFALCSKILKLYNLRYDDDFCISESAGGPDAETISPGKTYYITAGVAGLLFVFLKSEVVTKNVIDDGLPGLHWAGYGTPSSSYVPSSAVHKPRDGKQGNLASLTDIRFTSERSTGIWSQPSLSWRNKADIQRFVRLVLQDIHVAVGLPDDFDIFEEFSVKELHSEVQIVRKKRSGAPIGIIAIKTPQQGILNEPTVRGQLYDYLVLLKSYHGLENAFGILTTYEEYCVCWLSDVQTDALASAATIGAVQQPQVTSTTFVPAPVAPVVQTKQASGPMAVTSNPADYPMLSSPVFHYKDPTVVHFLASVLYKMSCAEHVRQIQELDDARAYVVMDENHWYFSAIKWRGKQLQELSTLPGQRCQSLILLRELRHGRDGRLWKACSNALLQCVLKFPKMSAVNSVSVECANHHRFGQAKARVARFGGSECLMIPVYSPIPDHLHNDKTAQDEIIAFVRYFHEQKHLEHGDLKLEHVMLASPTAPVIRTNLRFVDLNVVNAVDAMAVFDEAAARKKLFP